MDWFEAITGFRELDYAATKAKLEVVGSRLYSKINGKSYGIGELEVVSLAQLRERATASVGQATPSKVSIVRGDVRALHQAPEYAGALFQVASQFNLLEMVDPEVTPEDGVTRYRYDRTQGPACAQAAGAATIYRNYFANVNGNEGQTRERQLDGLALVGEHLSQALGKPLADLWSMRNGYAMCPPKGLSAISDHLATLSPHQMDDLRDVLRIGVHSDVEVTDLPAEHRWSVSQAFCSALPVAYAEHRTPGGHWAPFASLVLEAAYEATLWAAVLNARRMGSNTVLLTHLGGGAFGNAAEWIDAALRRALGLTNAFGLDVRLVSYGTPSASTIALAGEFGQ